jgi:hypothetical protein
MLNVQIEMTDWREGHNYGHFVGILSVLTIPEPTSNANAPRLGKWSSPSVYLGKKLTGVWWIRYVNFPEPGRWQELKNPTAEFFDTEADVSMSGGSFLSLYEFSPAYMSVTSGSGFLDTMNPEVGPSVKWAIPSYGPLQY